MSDPAKLVVEADLHALVDGGIAPERRSAVMDHLEREPDEARRVADWCTQNEAIRRAFGKTVSAPLPAALTLAPPPRLAPVATAAGLRQTAASDLRPPARPAWALVGALAVALLFGAAGGWVGAHGFGAWSASGRRPASFGADTAAATFADRAVEAHQTFAGDAVYAVEVPAHDRARLARWFEARLGEDVPVPDLAGLGYGFLGGRIVPTNLGAAAMLLFDGSGERLSLVVAPGTLRGGALPQYQDVHGNGTVSWTRSGDLVVLAGPPNQEHLLSLARRIDAVWNRPTP